MSAARLALTTALGTGFGLIACTGHGPGPRGPAAATDGLALTYYLEHKAPAASAPTSGGYYQPYPPPTEDTTPPARIVVVEQRRWVEIGADHTLEIDRVDDGADLESLVIESLSDGELGLGTCGRDSVVDAMHGAQTSWIGRRAEITLAGGAAASGTITGINGDRVVLVDDAGATTAVSSYGWRSIRLVGGDAMVRCQVAAGAGRRLVRVVYTTDALGFSADHAMRVNLDEHLRGTVDITPRFTIDTPAWQVQAEVALYDGMPGGARAPRELFHGPVTLSGEQVVVTAPTQTAPARLEAVYRGAMISPGEPSREPYWRSSSTVDIWDWLDLELGEATLPPGRLTMDIARAGEPVPEPAVVDPSAIETPELDDPGHVRIRLWPVETLRGQRIKFQLSTVSNEIIESFLFSVSNSGDRPREVIIEEEMRPAKKRMVMRSFPRKPGARGDYLRVRVIAPPGEAARAGYVLDYVW